MNFLLDTHVWIWSLTTPTQLNPATQAAFTQPQHGFFLSPISVWETLILIEKRRLPVDMAPDAWVALALQTFAVNEAPLTFDVARRSRQLALPHQDPADRFLAATALEYGLTLMTADQHLLALADLHTWPAR